MRNGSDVLNHNNFQTGSLQGADRSLTSLTGALNINNNSLHTVLHRGLGSGLSRHLRRKRRLWELRRGKLKV